MKNTTNAKKIASVLLIMVLAMTGCTQLPPSVETGVMPGQYNGANKTSTNEITALKQQLEEKESELQIIKDNFAKLNKNNEEIMKKLTETENVLKELKKIEESFLFPKLSSESTSKEGITSYLEDQASNMNKKYKNITMIPTKQDMILFVAEGYADGYNQLLLWETGKKEPTLIDEAYYTKNGDCQWLLEDKYIIINSGKTPMNESKIVDIDKRKVISIFQLTSDNIYLIPNSATILTQKPRTDLIQSSFVLYDFITGEDKEILPYLKGDSLEFEIDEEGQHITFTGKITDENGIEYKNEAGITMAKLKETYEIKTIDQSEKEKNPISENPAENNTTDENTAGNADITEETNETNQTNETPDTDTTNKTDTEENTDAI